MEHCFACGTGYAYLGTGLHEGCCPACGSTTVTPAGTLSIVDTTIWESANGLSTVHVAAADDKSRRFDFIVAARRKRGKLARLAVDGVEVPTDGTWSIPPIIKRTVAAHGIRVNDTKPARS